ncbi:hypothetical protein FPZ12_010445 [Amycolatopsis acidicola]|uniref:Uncharacterized protein n=1 Tax=Amycolatopsis acidicola TaxID=2596893 RepID=A0A5N0VCP1_9PSEU|nr:hypothetical protein [Amycolatopsis acidicola]KAA9162930.1 hypothetical protein FPZ12_010445 [Amycolatopsis acidicola]
MSINAGSVLVSIAVLAFVVWLVWSLSSPVVFRRVQLPRLAREHGWRLRKRQRGAPRDLPGDGGQGWEVPLPETDVEFLGRYRGRPVHGVQISVRKGVSYDALHDQYSANVKTYSVVSTALSDRPFDGFHDRNRGVAVNGDPMALYQDFADWARNRKPETKDDVHNEGSGLRSVSWRGNLNRKRLLRVLDELTAG